MVEATFIASGNSMEEAIEFAASLTHKMILGDKGFLQADSMDIFCSSIEDANHLNDILWEKPTFSVISHNLANSAENDLVKIGYPGTKFSLGSEIIMNLSPEIPKNLDSYKNYLQLVVMDGGKLRERAASTWTKCNKMGLSTQFIESI